MNYKDYTIIYNQLFNIGSKWNSITRKAYIKTSDVENIFEVFPDVVMIFEGFHLCLGEDLKDIQIDIINIVEYKNARNLFKPCL